MRDVVVARRGVVVLFVVIVGLCAGTAAARTPKEALQALEAHPFQRDIIRSAVQSLVEAAHDQSMDPWVFLGLAKASLIAGYRSGNRFDGSNFATWSIYQAGAFVNYALYLDPKLARAHAMRARIQMLEYEYREAWKTLNQAYRLGGQSFQPWYLMGVLNRFYKEYDRARTLLRKAKGLARHDYQTRWVLQALMKVADDTGDAAAEERLHKEEIELFPQRAHAYGNYGAFLLEQDRYEDAIVQLEKALSIHRYPMALKQLRKARRLAEEGE